MKRFKLGIIFLSLVLLVGCKGGGILNRQVKEGIEYSNLADEKPQEELSSLLVEKGVASKRVAKGFSKSEKFEVEYDELKLTENWQEKNPIYIGNNCRISAYDLIGDLIELSDKEPESISNLFMDLDALENDKREYSKDYMGGFKTLFASVDTENTKDIERHLANIKSEWEKRGIGFDRLDKDLSLISVFMHDDMDSILFIGHTGLLIKDGGDFYFLEKLAFDMPYQLIKFKNKLELNDYLMGKYDVSYGQEFAKPFIMENDNLLKEYRENPNNK